MTLHPSDKPAERAPSWIVGPPLLGAVYGLVVALLHGAHNPGIQLLDQWVLVLWCLVLYAVFACFVSYPVRLLFAIGDRLGLMEKLVPKRWMGIAPVAGLAAFQIVFWCAFFLYGLTYEQTVLVSPGGWVGMMLYLLVVALVVAAAATAITVAGFRAFARWPRGWIVPVALVLFAALGVPMFVGPREVARSRAAADDVAPAASFEKVVVLGFDGLDPEVVEDLTAKSQMPSFERLSRGGFSGPLETIPDANSAVIWASLYSGQPPQQHRVLDFYRVRFAGMRQGVFPVHRTFFKELSDLCSRLGLAGQVFVNRADLAVFPVWEIADHFGRSIGVVDGYLNSFPAPELDTEESFFLAYGAETLSSGLEEGSVTGEEVGLFIQPLDLLERNQLPQGEDFVWQSKTLLKLLETRKQPQLLMFYTHQPDTIQHQRWSGLEPDRYPPWSRDSGTEVVEWHRRLDGFVGRLLEVLEPDSHVLIASDHGHVATIIHALETQHRHGPPGYFLASGPRFSGSASAASIYDLVPTILDLLGLPVAADMPGRSWAGRSGSLNSRTLDTYEGLWRPRIQAGSRSRAQTEEELEKLRRMGYL